MFMRSHKYVWFLLPVFILILTSCSAYTNTEDVVGSDQNNPVVEIDSSNAEDTSTPEADHQAAESEGPFGNTTPAFKIDGRETNFYKHSVSYDEIFSGALLRDGIPPLNSPRFESVNSADGWIDDVEPVIIFDYARNCLGFLCARNVFIPVGYR